MASPCFLDMVLPHWNTSSLRHSIFRATKFPSSLVRRKYAAPGGHRMVDTSQGYQTTARNFCCWILEPDKCGNWRTNPPSAISPGRTIVTTFISTLCLKTILLIIRCELQMEKQKPS